MRSSIEGVRKAVVAFVADEIPVVGTPDEAGVPDGDAAAVGVETAVGVGSADGVGAADGNKKPAGEVIPGGTASCSTRFTSGNMVLSEKCLTPSSETFNAAATLFSLASSRKCFCSILETACLDMPSFMPRSVWVMPRRRRICSIFRPRCRLWLLASDFITR